MAVARGAPVGHHARGGHGADGEPEPPFPEGEWSFTASVLGCAAAISGHVFLDPSGRAAYIADGARVVGRGVGHWARDGGAAGLELDIFQYAAAAADIPEHPHRFRGVWALRGDPLAPIRGEWYFCPDGGDAPRLVGHFAAAAAPIEAAGVGAGPSQELAASVRDAAMAALAARCGVLRPLEPAEDHSLAAYAVGGVPTVYYVPNWIEEEQEAELLAMTDANMSAWEDMGTRATQEWGAGDRCPCGRGLERVPLPEVQQNLAEALHQLGVFDGALFPMNSVRINAYWPGQGIHPHCDGPVYYPKVAILSLGSACVFDFYPCAGNEKTSLGWDAEKDVPGGHVGGDAQISVLLEPRSLLVFGRDAFWHHRHGFKAVDADVVGAGVCNLRLLDGCVRAGDVINRRRRVSLTMRHLLPRCACQA